MLQFNYWFLPDGEHHLQEWMTATNRVVDGRLTYQYHKYEAARRYCTTRRRALDIGAHAGLWSYWMAQDFAYLEAFEPVPAHRACWSANMVGLRSKATLHCCALGDHVGSVSLTPGVASTGDTHVTPDTDRGQVTMVTLDSYYGMVDVDFIKIDCEGWELFVLRGAEQLLRREHPVIIVEQKLGHGAKYGIADRAGVEFLQQLGYRVRKELAGDVILTWGGV
jgi:FkbM family methyltransferase